MPEPTGHLKGTRMNFGRQSARRIVTAVLALVLCALAAPAVTSAQDPFEIDVLLSLTGPFANLGNEEKRMLDSMEPYVNKHGGIKGQPVHFVVYDDQSNSQTAVQLTNTLISKHVTAILGSDVGAECSAMGALLTDGPVAFCISPTFTPKAGAYTFVNGIDNFNQALGLFRFFNRRGWKRVAVVSSTDATGQGLDTRLADVMARKETQGMTVVATEHFNPGDINVDAVMSRVKAANPQAVVLWTVGTGFGTALHSLQNVGVEVPVGTTSGNAGIDELKQFSSFMSDDMFILGSQYLAPAGADPRIKTQIQSFYDAMKPSGVTVDYLTGTAWDPAMILIDAYRKLGTNATAAQIHQWIESQRAYPGITGVHDFTDGSQRGLSVSSVMITRWNKKTASFSSAEGEKVSP
jgi:branched-chain amino acid transport system substrate-binding protein